MNSKTIFCDIDGTLIKHYSTFESSKPDFKAEVLPGVIEKLKEWTLKNYRLILVT
jgi:histidinol phosphatase-like enzyme